MRTAQVALIILLVAVAGYAYSKDPGDCMKIVHDFGALFTAIVPTKADLANAKADLANGNFKSLITSAAAPVAPPAPPVPPAPPEPPPLPANSLIQNGDFSQGSDHWEGDGKSPAEYAAGNPVALKDPLTSKGLIVTLSPTSWTRIYQTFTAGPGTHFSIFVNYKLSPDISLSKNPTDYTGINKLIGISGYEAYGSFDASPGQFLGTVGDPTSPSIVYEVYRPTLGTSDVQNYQHSYPPSPVTDTKIFALAFPPGSGTVVILGAAVMGN